MMEYAAGDRVSYSSVWSCALFSLFKSFPTEMNVSKMLSERLMRMVCCQLGLGNLSQVPVHTVHQFVKWDKPMCV